MSNIEVVGLGALNIDRIHQVERILEDGETVVEHEDIFPGGSAANTIYGLAKLGINTGFMGAVGDDAEGEILLKDFRSAGVDTANIKVKHGAKTGAALCLSDKQGCRSIYVIPGANSLLTPEDLDLSDINQAKIFHVSSFADEKQFSVILEVIKILSPSVKVSFSPGALYAARGLETLAPILKKTYVLFVNRNEMRQLTGKDVDAGAETCLRSGCHIVAVTLGKGAIYREVMATSYVRSNAGEYVIESRPQNTSAVADTTGAGDAFAAGFLYGLLKGKSLQECGQLGDTLARFSVTTAGARQGLPTLGDMSQRYREQYHKPL